MDKIKQLLFDLIPVAIGVFLALWLSQLNTSISLKKEKEQALRAVANEVHRNTDLLLTRFPYHLRMYDSLSTQAKRNVVMLEGRQSMSVSFIATFNNGFTNGLGTYPSLSNTAWNSVLGSDIMSLIRYELRKSLFESYSNLKVLAQTQESTLSNMLVFNGNCFDGTSKPSDLLNFSGRLLDLLIQEKHQITTNLEILKSLESYLGEDMKELPSQEKIEEITDMADVF